MASAIKGDESRNNCISSSVVLNHFFKDSYKSGTQWTMKCKICCSKIKSRPTVTSNFHRHLRTHHNELYQDKVSEVNEKKNEIKDGLRKFITLNPKFDTSRRQTVCGNPLVKRMRGSLDLARRISSSLDLDPNDKEFSISGNCSATEQSYPAGDSGDANIPGVEVNKIAPWTSLASETFGRKCDRSLDERTALFQSLKAMNQQLRGSAPAPASVPDHFGCCEDADALFCRMIAAELKKINVPEIKNAVKRAILDDVFDGQSKESVSKRRVQCHVSSVGADACTSNQSSSSSSSSVRKAQSATDLQPHGQFVRPTEGRATDSNGQQQLEEQQQPSVQKSFSAAEIVFMESDISQ